jgi:hypothetical protein
MIPHNLLKNWTAEQVALMHNAIFVAEHRLAELELFSDEGLAHTLDAHPRADLGVGTMGSDPVRRNQWQEGDVGRLSGKRLLKIVERGRLSLDLRRVMDHHEDYRLVVNTLYDELESLCDCGPIFNRSANLVISSPTTLVYYHVDCQVSMLWHIRGTKRVWAYPLEAGVLSAKMLESVLYGEMPEEIEYYPELDRYAKVVDLESGQMMTWPQHTPYRIVNTGGLNVTLCTEHMTRRALRKNNVHLANRYLRRMLGCRLTSTQLDGFAPAMKELAMRVACHLPLVAPQPPQGYSYPVTFCVDPTAPDGIKPLGAPPVSTVPIVAPAVDVPNIDVPIGV